MSVIIGEKKSFKESRVSIYDNWQGKAYSTIKAIREFDGKKKVMIHYIRTKGESTFEERLFVKAYIDKKNQLWFRKESLKYQMDRVEQMFSVFGEMLNDDEIVRRYNAGLQSNVECIAEKPLEGIISNAEIKGLLEGDVSGPSKLAI